MKKSIIAVAMVCILLGSVVIVYACQPRKQQKLSLTRNCTKFDLVAGCCKTYTITLQNTGSSKVKIDLKTLISPDGDGITVKYSTGKTFWVKAKSTICIKVTVSTSPLLSPGKYTVETQFFGNTAGMISSSYK